jgi:uncharacterized membrane protein YphA (DoxX/SURF4 family)
MKNWIWLTFLIWWVAFGALCGLRFTQFDHLQNWLLPCLENLLSPFVPYINSSSIATSKIVSDSTGQYLAFIALFLMACAISTTYFRLTSKISVHYLPILLFYCRSYLSLMFWIYGINKLLHWQFPTPSPHLLYSQTGALGKDVMFWLLMGSSSFFNTITGSMEIIAGILLLWKPKWLLSSLLPLGITSFIVLVNFSFDISVKLFSTMLFVQAVLLAWHHPQIRSLVNSQSQQHALPVIEITPRSIWRVLILMMILVESTGDAFVNWQQGRSLFGHMQKQSELTGAYDILSLSPYTDASLKNNSMTNVFVNPNGHWIWMNAGGGTERYQLHADTKGRFVLIPSDDKKTIHGHYYWHSDTLSFTQEGQEWMTLKALPWKNAAILRDDIRLFMDSN